MSGYGLLAFVFSSLLIPSWRRRLIERPRWTRWIRASLVGIAEAIVDVVLELVMEATPVHLLERLVVLQVATNGPMTSETPVRPSERRSDRGPDLGFRVGAGEGNRTLMTSLEDR